MELTPKQLFILAASPVEWRDYADELKHAADVLYEKYDAGLVVSSLPDGSTRSRSHIARSYILLAGFAIENLFKALLVAQDSRHVNTGVLSKTLITHKLTGLASRIGGFLLTEDERLLCEMAEEAIPYWGRYPVPRKAEDVRQERLLNASFHRSFEALYSRARSYLENELADGWDSGEGMRLLPPDPAP